MNLRIPILMYHQVSNEPHPNFLAYTVTIQAFAAHMKILKVLGFVPVSINQLLDYKNGVATLPSKPVIITFDDGIQDAIDNAVPILKNSDFTAVFYIPTDYVGRKSSWMLPEVNAEYQIIDWATVKSLDRMGFEVGAHSMSHPYLDRIPPEDCARELSGSRHKLEEVLGHEVRHLAYPFGAYDESVKLLTHEAGFDTACTTEEAIARLSDDLLRLPRFNIGMEDTLLDFISKLYIAKSPTPILRYYDGELRRSIPAPVRRFIRKYIFKRKGETDA